MRRWSWLLLILGLSGCLRSVTLPPRTPELPTPATWEAGKTAPGPIEDSWWKTLGEPELEAIILEAIDNNRDLRAAAARLNTALIQAQIAGAGRVPTAGFTFNGNRRRQNFIGFPIPGSEDRVLSTTFGTLGASFDVNWEADLWGRISSTETEAQVLAQAQQADLAAAQLSIAGQTAKSWFASAEAQLQLELARETVGSYQKSTRWIRNRFEAGLRPALDLRLILSDLSTAEALISQRKEQYERTIRQIEVLAGRYPAGRLSGSNRLPRLTAPVPAGLPSELLDRRPDLISARKRLLASDHRVAQSQTALYPRLSLTSTGGTSSRSLLDLVDGDFTVWSLLAGLTQPLFQGGRLRRQVETNESVSQEALESYAGTVLRAFAEVETALAAEGELKQQLDNLEESASQARAALSLAQDRYRRGLADVLQVLITQRRVFTSQSQVLALRRSLLDNRINLHLALGGGFGPSRGGPQSLPNP